jgi:cytochrome c biogenesis protein CcdA
VTGLSSFYRTLVRYRTLLLFSLLALVALGLAAILGLGHPAAPMADMASFLPSVTLPAVIIGGLLDGVNPCAFTVLLIFITALLATMQTGPGPTVASVRRRLIGLGSIYIGSVFFTYLAIGVGVLATSHLFTRGHVSARVGALLAVLFGLWMLKDFFLPGWGPRLQAPASVTGLIRGVTRRMTVPALVGGGVLIGLCTVPCSGAVYLAILSLLAAQPSAVLGYSYLVLYNLVFVAPLVGILVLASSKPTLNRFKIWNMEHKRWLRLGLGAGVVLLGLAILATV